MRSCSGQVKLANQPDRNKMIINDFIVQYEKPLRGGIFFSLLIIMALWETLAPRRQLILSRSLRWLNNLGLIFLNAFIIRLLFPSAAVGMALYSQHHQWGLFNSLHLPSSLTIIISIILLDLIIYLQHVVFHTAPFCWRFHQVHHADLDYDVTTGLRFHTIEIILSMLIKFAAILVLGPPIVAVILFEILLNALSMFNHGNIALPKSIDNVLRWFIVTPDMHRIHHSTNRQELNSNFGFNLSCWDRLFGTYRKKPQLGQQRMIIGLTEYTDIKKTNRLWGMLVMPFRKRP